MASVINICNIALARIGNSRTINSLTEKTKEAYTCNLFYESMRDAVLADNDWNFAMSRVVPGRPWRPCAGMAVPVSVPDRLRAHSCHITEVVHWVSYHSAG
ncbi:hypothetical protein AB9K30_02345 [Klebsiella pneumoniae]